MGTCFKYPWGNPPVGIHLTFSIGSYCEDTWELAEVLQRQHNLRRGSLFFKGAFELIPIPQSRRENEVMVRLLLSRQGARDGRTIFFVPVTLPSVLNWKLYPEKDPVISVLSLQVLLNIPRPLVALFGSAHFSSCCCTYFLQEDRRAISAISKCVFIRYRILYTKSCKYFCT